ncbi:MAG: hypothetical protein EBR82_64845 [Caulobacteraceae bacterium]|nr:hypothetical protein [Caulobacteraceae bacterium]
MPAIWTAPRDWKAGEIVTPALMNAHVRDNISWLKTPTSGFKLVSSDIATTSTSFVDITGASVSITTNGGNVLCMFTACYTASTSLTLQIRFTQDGSPTVQLAQLTNPTTTGQMLSCFWLLQPAAGAHTFTVQHKAAIETGWSPA